MYPAYPLFPTSHGCCFCYGKIYRLYVSPQLHWALAFPHMTGLIIALLEPFRLACHNVNALRTGLPEDFTQFMTSMWVRVRAHGGQKEM